MLPSDFAGNGAAVDRVVDACPQVYNHNTETVPRLYREVRGRKADYAWTLAMFRRIKARNPAIRTKSGLMLGLGETREELLATLSDLLAAGCEMLTLGQYLRPSLEQMPVVRYLAPEEFQTSWARRPGGSVSSRWPAALSCVPATTPGRWRERMRVGSRKPAVGSRAMRTEKTIDTEESPRSYVVLFSSLVLSSLPTPDCRLPTPFSTHHATH